MDRSDQSELNGPNWTEVDPSGQNGLNRTNVDRIEPVWTEWTEVDRCGQNRTNVDRIEPMWTE